MNFNHFHHSKNLIFGLDFLLSYNSSNSGIIELKVLDKFSNILDKFFGFSALKTFLFHFIICEIKFVSSNSGIILYKAGLFIRVLFDISTILEIQFSSKSIYILLSSLESHIFFKIFS